MSIDEYLDEERKRGGILPPQNQMPTQEESEDSETEEATMKARAWDDFKDENPKGIYYTKNSILNCSLSNVAGIGNTMNRG